MNLQDADRAEQKLNHDSSSRNRTSGCALFAMNLLGGFQDANQAAAELTGYTRQELRTLAVDDLFVMVDPTQESVRSFFGSGESVREVLIRHRNGQTVPVELNLSTLQLGEEDTVFATVQTVTERRQAERELRIVEARYRAITENFPNGLIALYDHDLRYSIINGKGLADNGLTPADLSGKRLRDVFPPEVYQRDEPALLAALGGETTQTVVPFGDEFFQVITSPVRDEHQTIIGGMVMSQNVTPLKKTELVLQDTLDQLRLAISTAHLGIWRLTLETGDLEWNDQLLEIYGISRLEFQTKLDAWRAQVHPDDVDYANSQVGEVYKGKSVYDVEFRIIRPDGEVRYLNASAAPIYDDQHKLVELIGVNVDVTSVKKNEEALHEKETFLQAIFDNSLNAIMVADDAGTYISVNKAAADMFGHSVEQLVGMNVASLHTSTSPDAAERYQQYLKAGKEVGEFEFLHPNGENRVVQYHAVRIAENFHLSILADITDQKRTESTLQEHEERLQLVLKGANLGYWDWNIQTGEVAFNDRWTEMLGYSLAEIKPHIDSWFELIHPEDLPMVMDVLNQHLAGQIPYYETEHRMLAKDGSWRWVLDRGKVMGDDEGKPIRAAGTHLDITERKEIEGALVESEERFRALMQQSPLPMAIFAPDGALIEGNSALVKLWSLPPTAVFADGKFNALKSKRNVELGIDEYVRKAFAGEPVLIPPYESDAAFALEELGIVVDDIQKRWLRSHYYPIKDSNGNLINVVLVHEDITDRKRAEDDLQKAQERFEKAYRYHPIAMEMFRVKAAEKVDANQRYLEVMGYSWGELIGSMVGLDIWPDHAQRQRAVEILLEDRHLREYPAQLVTKTGDVRDVLISASMLDIDDGDLAIASYVDVTERNQAAESLQQLNQAIDQSPVSVVITDVLGNIEYVNPKFCEVTGYTLEEALGQNPRILNSGLHSKAFFEEMWAVITSGQVWRGEMCNRKKNGSLYWEQASIAGVKDSIGNLTHYVAVKEDITERRRIDEEHARQERLAAVGHLAAGIAHDFNNILGVIVIYAQMLSRSAELSERLRDRAVIIHQQARHASDLIQQILDFSRRSNMERQPLNLLPLLKEQVKLLERTLPEDIEVSLDYGNEEYILNADPTRIQQVVTNLAVNARDAMPHGGTLHMELSNVTLGEDDLLPVISMPVGEWTRLAVADTGTGISDHVMEYIFEPFFSTKERGHGTGLGLAQVYGIVKQHEGYINVLTEEGVGSTFELYFPTWLQANESDTGLDEPADLPQGESQRILLVEDDEVLLQVLEELLTNWNFSVLKAANGVEAVAILADAGSTVDLVLSDFIMPQMGGADLLAHISEKYPHIPVVFMTGHLDKNDMTEFEALGLKTWLSKPLDIRTLAQTIRKVVGEETAL